MVDVTRNVVEVVGPGTLIKDGSTLVRRTVWPGGKGAVIVIGYTPSSGLPFIGPILLTDFIGKAAGGLNLPVLSGINADGTYDFWLPPGVLMFNIVASGQDLTFLDGVYVAGPY